MIRILFRSSLVALSLLLFVSFADAQGSLRLPPSKRVRLSNGLIVILIEQHEVPIINFRVIVRAGSVLDPAGKEGLANLTAQLLRRGTLTRSAEKISAEIDFVGGKIELEADHDFADGQAEFLTRNLATGIDLLSDILRRPIFPLAEVTKTIRQEIDGVRQDKDQAETAISWFFDSYLFGSHPYARRAGGDERSLTAITRSDVLRFYHAHYGPTATTLVVAGDFSTSEMERLITEKLGSWSGRKAAEAPVIEPPEPVKLRKLLLVDKPDSTQTFFHIGNVGVARTNPDRVGIELVNTIFGGRFTSMLNDALRVSSGLTYDASSEFIMEKVAGPFAISSYTENATTAQAIDLAVDILKRLHAEGLSPQQVASAKSYLKGQFPPQIETSSQLAKVVAELDFYGLDESEVNDYFPKLDSLTVTDARRIIETYFPVDNLVFVLIGKADAIREQVRKYAPRIDERPISRPGFR